MFALCKKLLLSLLITSFISNSSFAEDFNCSSIPSGEYFALVNGNPITIEEFNRVKTLIKLKFDKDGNGQYPKIISNFIRTILISKIILPKAQEINLVPSVEQITKEVNLIKANQFKNNQEEFEKYINKYFCSSDNFLENIKEKVMVMNYLSYFEEKEFKVTQEELDDNYKKMLNTDKLSEMYKVSYIMIKDKKKLKLVYSLLKKGNDFGNLALKYSEDKGTSKNKGELGYFIKGIMIPEVERQAQILKIGKYNKKPVYNKEYQAYFIVKKTGFKKDYNPKIDGFRSFADQNFIESKKFDFFENYYTELIKNTDIKYNTSLEEYAMLDKDILR